MSDEEVEDFEINDYDLKFAMNPNYKRSKMSKQEAMLGIWADREYSDDSNDEDNFEGFKQKKRKGGNSKNIQFISGGVKGEKPKENSDDENKDEDNENSDSEDENVDSMLDELNRKATERENLKKIKPQPARQQFKGKHNDKKQKDFAEWEKHTKGIGMKLLQKMGWEVGKGIGKDLQGRTKPVEATLRKGKGAIGLYGSETTETNSQRVHEVEVEELEEKKSSKQAPQWRKTDEKKKPKYVLKTVEEIISEKSDYDYESKNKTKTTVKSSIVSGMSTSKIKVIDMTGKEQKILQGYESLSTRHAKSDDEDEDVKKEKQKQFVLPELLFNLDLLVNMTEEKILQSDKQLKYNEDMVMSMMQEEKRLNEKMSSEKSHIDRMNSLLGFIEDCEQKVKRGDVDIDDVIEIFNSIKSNYYNEYMMYNLSDLSLPLIIPIMNKYYFNWNPFKDEESRSLNYDKFKKLKRLLEDSNSVATAGYLNSFSSRQQNKQMDSYHRLIWEAWMPPIRQALLNCNIRNCDNIIDFIELWTPILPQWIIENILEQLIMPKLNSEVEKWNPLTDTVPINRWMHPWLPLMKKRLDPLYAPIRHKLANALTDWHPSDDSAKAILMPWKMVFSSHSWDLFMINSILPKLAKCLEEFDINPGKQNIEPWKWIMNWEDIVPTNAFIGLIEKKFFPKWLQVLSLWLNSNPNYEEVSRWYLGWKTVFSEKLLNNPTIKSKLSQGLIMMNNSASGIAVSYTPVTPSATQATASTLPSFITASLETLKTTSNPAITSFKEMIEKKAADHNLLFVPVKNRFQEGKQVHRLGNVNVYIDRNVIFYLNNGIWSPSSLNEVIKEAL